MTRSSTSLAARSTRSRGPILIGALLLHLAGCGTDDRTAGASTETTNGLTGTVHDAQGALLAGARVTVWDSRGQSALGTTVTDASGRWNVAGVGGTVGIEVVAPDNGSASWTGGYKTTSDSSRSIDLSLSPTGNLFVEGQNLSRLAGTPWSTRDGTFRDIPAGSYTVLSDTSPMSPPLGSIRLSGHGTDTLRPVRDSGLLVEDFDDGDSNWIFGPVRDNGVHWFVAEGPSGAHLVAPLVTGGSATVAMETEGAWHGRSLHLRYTSTDSTTYVEAGTAFGGNLDLTNLRGVRIRLRGNGRFALGLDGNREGSGEFRAFWPINTLDTAWQEVHFQLPGTTKTTTRYNVFRIMLQAYGGTDLWIDDIRFDGIVPENCLP